MKFEFSAGGIVYKSQKAIRQPTDKDQKSGLYILLAKHSHHKGWVFPKGLIDREKKESKEQAAIREVKEETGAEGEIQKALEPSTFWYAWSRGAGSRHAGDGERRKKTVYYFIMKYLGGDISEHDYEMEDVEWVEAEKVLETLTHKGEKDVFKKDLPEIEKLAKN